MSDLAEVLQVSQQRLAELGDVPDVLEAWGGLLYIEGILNAMVSWLALRGKGFGIVGLGSAFGLELSLAERMSLPLWLYLDNDIVGNKSAKSALAQARGLGLEARQLGSLLGIWMLVVMLTYMVEPQDKPL